MTGADRSGEATLNLTAADFLLPGMGAAKILQYAADKSEAIIEAIGDTTEETIEDAVDAAKEGFQYLKWGTVGAAALLTAYLLRR